ncbi:MAG: winged helix DNA-binding protein [Candidatus Altiarchaeota archaeon]|nr:winged helix DNA-binding protein [Candidatus Altiarchaeota archaeon]
METQVLSSLILHEKPAGIILSLKGTKGKYASVLSKENDCTYTHTLKILNILEETGLVEFSKEGRIKFIKLTDAGEDVAHELEGLVRHLEKVVKKDDTKKGNLEIEADIQ